MTRQKLRKLIGRARKHARNPGEQRAVDQWVELIEQRGRKHVSRTAFIALREIDTHHNERKLAEANAAMVAGDWRKVDAFMMRAVKQ